MALGEQCRERCLWGTGRNPRVSSLTRACGALPGRTSVPLLLVGPCMDFNKLKLDDGLGGTEGEGSQGLPPSGVATSAPERALQGGNGAAVGEAAVPRKRNRCGAEKRRAKRDRELASAGSDPSPSGALGGTPKGADKGPTGKRGRTGSGDTPPSVQRVVKRPRAQVTGPYVSAADPLARAIVLEGYPEQAVTPEQLTLLRGAVVAEMAGIREGPLPRFTGTAVLRNGAVVIRGEDEMALNWLSERIGHISPWEGAKLGVVGLDALQKRHRAAVWVPGPPVPAAAVLGLLERQNPGIATASWQVFAENVGASPEGRNLILGIPESSVLKLRARDFRLSYGLEQITVGLLGARSEATGQGESQPASCPQ